MTTPIPATADQLAEGTEVALTDESGELLATMKITEKYRIDKALATFTSTTIR